MTDLLDRMAAANPARADERPPLDDVWRKIAADATPARAPWHRAGGRALLVAGVAVPVVAVILIAVSAHRAAQRPHHPAVTGIHHGRSTIDPAVQRSARRALGKRSGSIVVMNPQTGAIRAMATTGSLRGGPGASVPPGATFDVVTLAAALTSGRYGPHSLISGASPLGVAGAQVRNNEQESFGRLTLSDALALSVNTVFARVGAEVGESALTREMRLFELPSRAVAGGRVAVGPLAAGQGPVTVTPLQLATMAATIANRGWLAQPHATALAGPAPQRPVMSPGAARLLTQMLRRAVTDGTATAANLPGLSIAGKTGNAPAGPGKGAGSVVSFIGFAPADHPTVAIAVVLNAPRGAFGGTVAAPLAARVIRDVLRGQP
ncbi:MAG: penicillin-binding transpeptidase domain-containing protein [Solirubrobacteraceae bacterium]